MQHTRAVVRKRAVQSMGKLLTSASDEMLVEVVEFLIGTCMCATSFVCSRKLNTSHKADLAFDTLGSLFFPVVPTSIASLSDKASNSDVRTLVQCIGTVL